MTDFEAVCERELGALLVHVGQREFRDTAPVSVLELQLPLVKIFLDRDAHMYVCCVSQTFRTELCGSGHNSVRCGTSYKAVFASPARLSLAVQSGLILQGLNVSYAAGRYGSIEILTLAKQLGLAFDDGVLRGAARSASLSKLKWLVEGQKTSQDLSSRDAAMTPQAQVYGKHTIATSAARGGSVEMMQWLHEQGARPTGATLTAAAKSNHLQLVQYLRSIETPYETNTATLVAEYGHLRTLQWIMADGCPCISRYNSQHEGPPLIAKYASSMEILRWLQDHCDVHLPSTEAAAGAAGGGQIEMLEWLLMQQGCEATDMCSSSAIMHAMGTGDVSVLAWLFTRGLFMPAPQGVHMVLIMYFGICAYPSRFKRVQPKNYLITLRYLAPLMVSTGALGAALTTGFGAVAVLTYVIAQIIKPKPPTVAPAPRRVREQEAGA